MTTTATPAAQDIAFATSERSCVHSSLHLNFAKDPATDNTFLAESLQEPPLKVVRAFTLDDGTALVHLHNVSGGLLGGDQLHLRVTLRNQTNVQLTTTSATRIYRHRSEFPATTQRNEITIGEGAFLEYVPDAMIPFADARFSQQTSINLAPGASLFYWEIISPGREARGEIFQYEQFEMRTNISARGRSIAAENIRLCPAANDITSLARLGPCRYSATFYICQVGIDANSWRAAEDHLRELTSNLTRPGEVLWGVSTLVAHGLVVRCLSRHGRDVLSGLHAVWRRAKLYLYGREAIPPRKVN
jgi:urease accessory protein